MQMTGAKILMEWLLEQGGRYDLRLSGRNHSQRL